MKNHIILSLYQPLSDNAAIPSWLEFINNKTVVKESIKPEIDRLMNQLGLKF